jgi:ABC-type taurine transport system ATPase subunit
VELDLEIQGVPKVQRAEKSMELLRQLELRDFADLIFLIRVSTELVNESGVGLESA